MKWPALCSCIEPTVSVLYTAIFYKNARISGSSCPKDYPYAFSNGDKCCANDIEGTDGAVGELCDGGDIGLDSSCCLDDEHLDCGDKPCSNNEGT